MERGLRGIVIGANGIIESVHFDPKRTPKEDAQKLMQFVVDSNSGMVYLQETDSGDTAYIPFSGEELEEAKHSPIYQRDEFISRAWGDIRESLELRIYPRDNDTMITSS